MEIASLTETFDMLEKCCLHDPQWRPGEVTEVLAAFWNGTGSWVPLEDVKSAWDTDSESVIAVKLNDGSYGLLTENEDYTGHGCQCDAFTGWYPTAEDLIFHCEDGYRDKIAEVMGIPIPSEPVDA